MYKLIIITFLVSSSIFIQASPGSSISDTLKIGWKKFWTVTCEFSTLTTSREKRSTNPDFPNVKDADELFDYLYPSLDFKADDFVGGGRSSNPPNPITSWLDDLIEMWENECHWQTTKEEEDLGEPRERVLNLDTTAPTTNVSSNTSISHKHNLSGNSSKSHKVKKAELQFANAIFRQEDIGTGDGGWKNGSNVLLEKQDASMIALQGVPPPLNPVNTFFAPFGGDIEYFFPLLSFGIPFNGDISILGFHGFKGIFPYKKR